MDPGMLNTAGTVIFTIAFVALCFWAYSPAQRARFEEDARLPFLDDRDEGGPR